MRKYLFKFAIFLFLLCVPLAHNYLLLRNIGELKSPQEVAASLANNPECIYSSALFDSRYFKYEIYNLAKPEVMALGSSRVLQIRPQFFTRSFYNMGSTISTLAEMHNVVDHIIAHGAPKIIILGADFWWFNDNTLENNAAVQVNIENKLKTSQLSLPFKWLQKKKVGLNDYLTLPYKRQDLCRIGISSVESATGFGAGGDYNYTGQVTTIDTKFGDYHFKDIDGRIDKGKRKYEYASQASDKYIEDFIGEVKKLESHGAKVIIYFPPLATHTIERMQGKDYGYIKDLKAKLRAHKIKFFDYTAAGLGSADCEFIDGFHGGDITAARIIRKLGRENSGLDGYLAHRRLDSLIKNYAGLAMIPNLKLTAKPEVDFLGIGCKKENNPRAL